MPSPRDVHRGSTRMLSAAMIVLGVAILARTLVGGVDGVALGLLLGPLFIAAGVGRLYLAR